MKSISTEYRVVADIPNEVWKRFSDTPDYAARCGDAVRGFLEAGSCYYDTPYEWATFSTRGKAENALKKLNAMIAHFEAKLAEAGECDEH